MAFFVPDTATVLLPEERFDALINEVGQRVGWMRSHPCPCTYSFTQQNNRIAIEGAAQRACQTCHGIGFYWDPPGPPFRAYISFMQMAATPNEPGVVMNDTIGMVQMADPSITIPYFNTNLDPADPAQPTDAWVNATTDDLFVAVDMVSRYTAMLQVGGQTNLPFQQNLSVGPVGAVTVWNPTTSSVEVVTDYAVTGPEVIINGYPDGTSYMVEFQAAAVYVAWKRAGGLPHIRPFGGGTDKLPRRFRLQTLDPWMRQRGIQPSYFILPTLGKHFATLSDTLAINDNVNTGFISFTIVADIVNAKDSIGVALSSRATMSDTIGVSDSIGVVVINFTAMSDIVNVNDSIGVVFISRATMSDTLNAGDSMSAVFLSSAIGYFQIGINGIGG